MLRTYGGEDPETLTAMSILAKCLMGTAAYSGAVPILERVAGGRSRVPGGEHPATLDARKALDTAHRMAVRVEVSRMETENDLAGPAPRKKRPQQKRMRQRLMEISAQTGSPVTRKVRLLPAVPERQTGALMRSSRLAGI